jgi:ABC-type uncharacterized transport system permease subunit
MLPIDWNPGARVLRSFARLWFPLFVALAGAVLRWRFGEATAALAVWIAGGVMIVGVLASPRVARAVFIGLMVVTYPIGFVVSTAALAAVFFLVFTPIGWAMRLAGRDPLRLRTRGEPTEWQACHHDDDPERLFRQF